MKFSSTTFTTNARQRRLGYFQEVMRQLQSRYEVTDLVISFIKDSLSLSNLHKQSGGLQPGDMHSRRAATISERMIYPPPGSHTKNWCEVLIYNPRLYLRLSLSLDFALARGHFPRHGDLDALFSQLEVSDLHPSVASFHEPFIHTDPGMQEMDPTWADFNYFQPTQGPPKPVPSGFRLDHDVLPIAASVNTSEMFPVIQQEQPVHINNPCNLDYFEL